MPQLNLNDIGRSADLFKTGPGSPLSRFLFDWAEEQIFRLRAEAPKASGNLGQSITTETENTDESVALQIEMAEYWDFVNEGVDGTQRSFGSPYKFKTSRPSFGMVKSMRDMMWPATKGLQPKQGQSIDDMLWAISAAVKKHGIEPTYFFEKVMTDETITALQNDLAEQFGRALLEKTFNNL